jgi:AcrR family transcriptional regulator
MARTPDKDLQEKRRRQILDAALACFARKGFHQTSMQEICSEAGLSAGALYRYFASKSELIVAIAERDCQEFRAPLASDAEELNFYARLAAASRSWVERLTENDRALVAEVIAEAARDPLLAARLRETDRPMREALAALILEGKARGEVDNALNVDQAVRTVVLALDGIAIRFLISGKTDTQLMLRDFQHLFERFFAPPVGKPTATRKTRALAETAL